MIIGIVSDTHGLLRPELFDRLQGVERILHAGDLGPVELLSELEAVAPVTGVYGNTDGWDVRHRLPEVARLEIAGRRVVVLHGHQHAPPGAERLARAYPGADLIVYGHTHVPEIRRVGETLVINPGSAGPRRFTLPVTLVRANLGGQAIDAELIHLLGEPSDRHPDKEKGAR